MINHVSQTDHIAEMILIQKRRRHLTYTQVGAIINLSRQSLARRLTGETPWKIDELDMLSVEWDMPLNDLIGGFNINGTRLAPHP